MTPTTAAVRLSTHDAAAAMSFAWPASGWNSGDTRSTTVSIAVLRSSAAMTMPQHTSTTAQLTASIRRMSPIATANAPPASMTLMFRSWRSAVRNPCSAKRKLRLNEGWLGERPGIIATHRPGDA